MLPADFIPLLGEPRSGVGGLVGWFGAVSTTGVFVIRILSGPALILSWIFAGLGTYKSQDIGGAVEAALRAGYRHIDCASHYHNEHLIGDAIHRVLKEGVVKREDLFVTSKLW